MFSITVHTSESVALRNRTDMFSVTAHTGESEKKQNGYAYAERICLACAHLRRHRRDLFAAHGESFA